jgi:hypothetical protein
MQCNRRRAVRTAALLVGLCATFAGATASAQPAARPARTISISDSANLHLTSHHGFTLNEEGKATGTISGRIYIHLTVTSTNHVSAEVNIYPSGGSLTGVASAGYHPSGSVASFNGTMRIARGSGRYSHASGSGLSFTGTVRRTNDAVTVHVSGRIST